jgi:hypothetical protein
MMFAMKDVCSGKNQPAQGEREAIIEPSGVAILHKNMIVCGRPYAAL